MISVREVLRQARVNVLRDTDADDFEFGDRELLDALNDTIQTALKLKPILLWTDTHTYREASAFKVSSADGSVDFPEDLEEALVMGVCGNVCEGLQADAGMLQAAQRYEQKFVQLVRM